MIKLNGIWYFRINGILTPFSVDLHRTMAFYLRLKINHHALDYTGKFIIVFSAMITGNLRYSGIEQSRLIEIKNVINNPLSMEHKFLVNCLYNRFIKDGKL